MNKSLKLAIVAGTVLFAVPSHGMFRHVLNRISCITTFKKGPNTAKRFFSTKQLTLYKKNQTDTTATDTAIVKKIENFVVNWKSPNELVAVNYFLYKITNSSKLERFYHPSQKTRLNERLIHKGLADPDGNIPKNIRKIALSFTKKDYTDWIFD